MVKKEGRIESLSSCFEDRPPSFSIISLRSLLLDVWIPNVLTVCEYCFYVKDHGRISTGSSNLRGETSTRSVAIKSNASQRHFWSKNDSLYENRSNSYTIQRSVFRLNLISHQNWISCFCCPLAVLRSQNDLGERLQRKRAQRMKKLEMEQAVEKDEFDRKVISAASCAAAK